MKDAMDTDGDGRIGPAEFVDFFLRMQTEPDTKAAQVVDGMTDMLFLCADRDGNGSISADEFAVLCKAYGASEAVTKQVFGMHAHSKPGEMSRAEWDNLIKESFYSNDPNAQNDQAGAISGATLCG